MTPDLSLFLEILRKLEQLDIAYVVIGGFAATFHGVTRSTIDIDIVVDLSAANIEALAAAFPLPRYYADPQQMHSAVAKGLSFNIIDSQRGEKADLFPVSMDPSQYQPALANRQRRRAEPIGIEPIMVWIARPEDIVVGKLMAWKEGQSPRHTSDIYQMMLTYYTTALEGTRAIDTDYVTDRANELGEETAALWRLLENTAREEADK